MKYELEKLTKYLIKNGFKLEDNILIGNLDRLPMSMINFLSNSNILLEFKA